MKVTKTTVPERVEILANDHYVGIPIKIALGSGETRKQGTPITMTGTVATGADTAGILLYTVDERNPNGTIVVHGFIETARAQALSGVTITDTMKAALPMVRFN